MKRLSKMFWIISAILIIMLTVLTRQVESYGELTLEYLAEEGYYSGGKYYFSPDGWDNGMSKFNNLYCVEKGDSVPDAIPNHTWSLLSKAVISGESVTFYKCSNGNKFSSGTAGKSGRHNNKLAAILCEDDFDLGRYVSAKDTTSQVSLWSYWNEWVSTSGASSIGMETCSENDKKIYNTAYDQYIDKYEYNVTIYYFEPTKDADQNLILVNRGEIKTATPKIQITVNKVWDDNKNANKTRPGSVTVYLLANNNYYDSGTITGYSTASSWSHTFTNLPKTDKNGYNIQYDVVEAEVDGYTSSKSGNQSSGFTITNTIVVEPEPEPEPEPTPDPETTTITVTKKWDDENNRDGLRPDKITVTLYADGVKKQTVSFGESQQWIYKFKDLPKTNANGSSIVYTVEETTVTGYELTQENIYTEEE